MLYTNALVILMYKYLLLLFLEPSYYPVFQNLSLAEKTCIYHVQRQNSTLFKIVRKRRIPANAVDKIRYPNILFCLELKTTSEKGYLYNTNTLSVGFSLRTSIRGRETIFLSICKPIFFSHFLNIFFITIYCLKRFCCEFIRQSLQA